MARFVGRENVRNRLAALEGRPGCTVYKDGQARIETPDETIVVRPPFGLAHEGAYESVELDPLLQALAADHTVAVLLVRLGGYAVGVLEGDRLVASKVGARFVKGRHKKGGSSQARFRRRRDEQARALIDEAAEVAVRVLEPWRDRSASALRPLRRGALERADVGAIDAELDPGRRYVVVCAGASTRVSRVSAK
jgi:hypothetical protein